MAVFILMSPDLRTYWDLGKIYFFPNKLVSAAGLTDLENEEELSLALDLTQKKHKIGATALMFLDQSPPDLPLENRIATLLFSGLVYQVDDLIDNHDQVFKKEEDLENFLLTSSIKIGESSVSIQKVVKTILSCLPEEKKEVLNQFLEQMIKLQVEVGNRGFPGEYGFDDAWRYKESSNMAFVDTGLSISKSRLTKKESLLPTVLGVQMYDDVFDVMEDADNGIQNLFIGLSCDVWEKKARPHGQDLDFLITTLKSDVFGTQSSRDMIRRPEMKDTRTEYKTKFRKLLSQPGQVPLGSSISLIGKLVI